MDGRDITRHAAAEPIDALDPAVTASPQPAVSVIIPTFERRVSVLRCLGCLAACRGAGSVEVVVVDQSLAPLEASMCAGVSAKFHSFHIICRDRPNLPAARNAGARLARGPLLLFLDDDVDVSRAYIENLIDIFARQLADVVSAPESPLPKASAGFKAVEWLPGTNVGLRREDFFAVCGYDENLSQYNEDAEFCHRLRRRGLRLYLYAGLQAVHRKEASGGVRHRRPLRQAARIAMRSDLYFTRAIGGGPLQMARCAAAAVRRELRGFGKLQGGTTAARGLACLIALPGAVLYTFRRPLLLPEAADASQYRHPAATAR